MILKTLSFYIRPIVIARNIITKRGETKKKKKTCNLLSYKFIRMYTMGPGSRSRTVTTIIFRSDERVYRERIVFPILCCINSIVLSVRGPDGRVRDDQVERVESLQRDLWGRGDSEDQIPAEPNRGRRRAEGGVPESAPQQGRGLRHRRRHGGWYG